MIGAVIGDIIGSTYELHNVKTEKFELFPRESHFTDDTVLSVAVADKLLNAENSKMDNKITYAIWYKQYYRRFPHAGFGQMFSEWAASDGFKVQHSYGNGGAMRVTAIGYAFDDLKEIINEVDDSIFYTHKHPEAKRGARAVATAVYLARKQEDKEDIKRYLEKKYKYRFIPLDELRNSYVFDSRASYSVPPAIQAFLESTSYESAIRKAISIGGDSDTIACITGGIAEAYYGVIPEDIMNKGMSLLDSGMRNVIRNFKEKYG